MDAARVFGSGSGGQRFELRKELGAGSFGTVWEARDRDRDELVALKALSRIAGEAVFRFKQEFRAAQDLSHPNLVRLTELFELDGGWFFSMELVEGADFCDYTRPNGKVNYELLRESLLQLLQGLAALHAAGLVHRDIKPSNVRVTTQGRVVILDFGMSSRWTGGGMSTQIPGGTAAYMAPEQAFPNPVGPAADLYAVGAMLYEAITGEVPFDGSPLRVLLDKQSQLPQPPATRVEGVPVDLNLLCIRLLQVDPTKRPTVQQAFAALGVTAASGTGQSGAPPGLGTQSGLRLCVGRRAELGVLEGESARARQGPPRVVLIEGQAGIGKSALLAHFLEGKRAQVALRGRCHELENVAHKGFDGLVDALARYLKRLSADECEALLPIHVGLLARMFPVLGRVPSIASKQFVQSVADPTLLKRQAFDALFELFGALSGRGSLVLAIDDLHFSDLESIRTLSHYLTAEHAPALLLVVTLRPFAELDMELRTSISELVTRTFAATIELGPLSPADSRRLVSEVLGYPLDGKLCDAVVREGAGHPQLLLTLAQHAQRYPTQLAAGLELEQVLRARLTDLGRTARAVLEALALAGVALSRSTIAAITDLPATEVSAGLAELRAEKLLKTDRRGGSECFHPELRGIAVAQIEEAEKRNRHRAIALALAQQPGSDAAVVAGHWVLAGDPGRAVPMLLCAADQLNVALGFDRAASLYKLALEHGQALPEQDRWQIRVRLAHALAGAGAGEEAARQYVACAALATTSDEALDLRCRAAHQWLRSLKVEEGLEVATALLSELSVPVERDATYAGLSLKWQRARLRLRGLSFRARRGEGLAPDMVQDLDLMNSLTTAWTRVELVRGYALTAHYVRCALDTGEMSHVANGLAIEAEQLSAREAMPQPRTKEALASAEALAAKSGSRYAAARVVLARGTVAWIRADLREASDALSRADRLFAEGCADANWERMLAQSLFLSTSLQQGYLTRHTHSADGWLSEARARGDLAARGFLVLVGGGYERHLARDDPDAALDEVERAMSAWSAGRLSPVHARAPWARLDIVRYREGVSFRSETQALVEEAWAAAKAVGLLDHHASSVALLEQRARVRLGFALSLSGGARKEMLNLVTADVAAVRKHRWGVYDTIALELSAQVAWLHGQHQTAERSLRATVRDYEATGLRRRGQSARYLLGRCIQGNEGAALVAASIEWTRREGVRNASRYFALMDALAEARA